METDDDDDDDNAMNRRNTLVQIILFRFDNFLSVRTYEYRN